MGGRPSLVFAVIPMDKTMTKVSIVFDCSAKTDDVSMNDAICADQNCRTCLMCLFGSVGTPSL